MPYTVRLCHGAVGWFATQQPVRSELGRAQVETEDGDEAFLLYEMAWEAAKHLDRFEAEERVARAIARLPLFG
jgi:hypothetical protein